MCEHLGVSALTGKTVKADNDSAIKEHDLTVCSCHVTYAFESESTLYSCLNVNCRNMIYFAITHVVLTIFPYQLATTMALKLP